MDVGGTRSRSVTPLRTSTRRIRAHDFPARAPAERPARAPRRSHGTREPARGRRREPETPRVAEAAFDTRPVKGPEADAELAVAGKALDRVARVRDDRSAQSHRSGLALREC